MGNFQVGNVRVGVILGKNFLSGNCPGESYPGREFSLVGIFWVGITRWE